MRAQDLTEMRDALPNAPQQIETKHILIGV